MGTFRFLSLPPPILITVSETTGQDDSQADRLRHVVESVRSEQPSLERQLADYRDRPPEYDKLRNEGAQAPLVISTPAGAHRVC